MPLMFNATVLNGMGLTGNTFDSSLLSLEIFQVLSWLTHELGSCLDHASRAHRHAMLHDDERDKR